jgi:hypothetical protein
MTAWAASAIYYGNLAGARLRAALALGFVLARALAFASCRTGGAPSSDLPWHSP